MEIKNEYTMPAMTEIQKINFLKRCKRDKNGFPCTAPRLIKPTGIVFMFLGIAITILTLLMALAIKDAQVTQLSKFLVPLGILCIPLGFIFFRYRVRLTETHLDLRFVTMKRTDLKDIIGYTIRPSSGYGSQSIFLDTKTGKQVPLPYIDLKGGAEFIRFLEKQTGIEMFRKLTGLPEDYVFEKRINMI